MLTDYRTVGDDNFSFVAHHGPHSFILPALLIKSIWWDNPTAISDLFKELESSNWTITPDNDSEVISWLKKDFMAVGLKYNYENIRGLYNVMKYAKDLKMF